MRSQECEEEFLDRNPRVAEHDLRISGSRPFPAFPEVDVLSVKDEFWKSSSHDLPYLGKRREPGAIDGKENGSSFAFRKEEHVFHEIRSRITREPFTAKKSCENDAGSVDHPEIARLEHGTKRGITLCLKEKFGVHRRDLMIRGIVEKLSDSREHRFPGDIFNFDIKEAHSFS